MKFDKTSNIKLSHVCLILTFLLIMCNSVCEEGRRLTISFALCQYSDVVSSGELQQEEYCLLTYDSSKVYVIHLKMKIITGFIQNTKSA